MIDESLLKREEKAVFALRALYQQFGYRPFKMNKFEEYELYIRNKDFLVSDRIITFNDTNGKLLALKPDVTLSIIQHGSDLPGCKQKVYYDENVYRISDSTHQYKEIMQTGLECIGDIDLYDIFETVMLAAQSLSTIDSHFMLEISHMGLLAALLEEIDPDDNCRREITGLIAAKNAHDLRRVCENRGLSQTQTEALCALVHTYGKREQVIASLEAFCPKGAAATALEQLKALSALLDGTPLSERILFDFSVVNDMGYYNGIVFRGFLDGICDSVLAGGQYDALMHKMGRDAGAIGFALYLDRLEQLPSPKEAYDIDVLLVYDDATAMQQLSETVCRLTRQGKRVCAQKAIPPKLRYAQLLDLRKGEALC